MGSIKFESWDCINSLRCCGNLSPQQHYPAMTRYPKGTSPEVAKKAVVEGSEAKAVFSVVGMTCAACAGSVEKAIKRLPGIRQAVVDVLNDKAQVLYYPAMVNVSIINYLSYIYIQFPFYSWRLISICALTLLTNNRIARE